MKDNPKETRKALIAAFDEAEELLTRVCSDYSQQKNPIAKVKAAADAAYLAHKAAGIIMERDT